MSFEARRQIKERDGITTSISSRVLVRHNDVDSLFFVGFLIILHQLALEIDEKVI